MGSGVAKKLKLASVEKVFDFTYENRLNQKISKKDIAEFFNSFIEGTKDAVLTANNKISGMFRNTERSI